MMTTEQIKQANGLVEDLELLQKIAINVGRDDLNSITLHFLQRGDMPITEPVMKIVRSGIEQALAEEMAKCRQNLADQYNVRAVA